MAQDNGSGRRNQDGNGSSGSSLLLWAGLIVATGLLVIMWVAPLFTREIQPEDLKKLIAVSGKAAKANSSLPNYVEVADVRKPGKTITVSDLQRVVVRDRSVTGMIHVYDPNQTSSKPASNEEPKANTPFRTSLGADPSYR